MNLLTEHARELLGMPPEWDSYELEAIGTSGQPAKMIRVAGAVAPLKTRGQDKGAPNWRKADPATDKTAYFTPAEHEAWEAAWEQKTGKCAECVGTGQKMAGWDVKTGVRYKPCVKCGATGKAAEQSQPAANSESSGCHTQAALTSE